MPNLAYLTAEDELLTPVERTALRADILVLIHPVLERLIEWHYLPAARSAYGQYTDAAINTAYLVYLGLQVHKLDSTADLLLAGRIWERFPAGESLITSAAQRQFVADLTAAVEDLV